MSCSNRNATVLWSCVLSLHALPTVNGHRIEHGEAQKKPATPEVCGFWFEALEALGLPGGTRTPDLLLRRQLLYPVELRAVWDVAVDLGIIQAHPRWSKFALPP